MTEHDPAPVAEVTPAAEDATRTFTQDEVNRIVADRLNRQKAQFADYDDLKTKAEEYDKTQAAQMTAVERAQAEAKAAAERAARLEAELGGVKRVNDQRALLAEMGFTPQAVESLAGRLAGDDADAWRADAEKFQSFIPKAKPVPPAAANSLDVPESETDRIKDAIRKGAGVA